MKTFREYLQEVTPQSGQPGAMAGTNAAANDTIGYKTGGATPGAQTKPTSAQRVDTRTQALNVGSPTTTSMNTSPTTQGTATDMEKPEAVINVKAGQTIGQTNLKDFKATITPGEEEIEFEKDGKTFKLPQELFIDEDLQYLKKLSGIQK